ncbi:MULTISPECIES: Rieske (2Fe-2S) protein [Nonomuraea]|uniref:Rieske (2Fe-2S) protein n=1 Tax=Nonomuraea ferruginea TaxID=46174 RepID=A0ABT4SQG9_9ACTN|nr:MULTISPECIES: Rieske (2Fe-2S) protein [Nonomuraea]MDA0639492.1 Rieske (2Fe-2S) protein [Nonomuraea ferruginea]TXK42349.1 Rieske (2Fe-2S) protein [Nonomuraea sp. C10]
MSTPAEWVEVASLRELERRNRKLVTVGAEQIALFLVDGEVYALADTCVHKRRSLSKGTLLHGRVICPGHQWSFDPRTGEADGQDRCQPVHAVRVDDGVVYVDPRPRALTAEESR